MEVLLLMGRKEKERKGKRGSGGEWRVRKGREEEKEKLGMIASSVFNFWLRP